MNQEVLSKLFYLNKTVDILKDILNQSLTGQSKAGIKAPVFWHSDDSTRGEILRKREMSDPSFREHLTKLLKFGMLVKLNRGKYLIDPAIVEIFEILDKGKK